MEKLYTMSEIYKIIYNFGRNLRFVRKAKSQKLLSNKFIERIMLAVIEVNKCEMCSYAHTKMALESGLDKQEISDLLGGELSSVPSEEITAVLFAQYYASSRACPSEKAWNTLIDTYGETKAKGILGVIRTITFGNAFGIPFGSLINRIKGKKPDTRSSLRYEIGIIFVLLFVTPFALVHGLIASYFNKKIL